MQVSIRILLVQVSIVILLVQVDLLLQVMQVSIVILLVQAANLMKQVLLVDPLQVDLLQAQEFRMILGMS